MTPFQILRVAHLLPGAWIISRRSSMDEWEKNYRVLQRYSRKAIKAFGFELHVLYSISPALSCGVHLLYIRSQQTEDVLLHRPVH